MATELDVAIDWMSKWSFVEDATKRELVVEAAKRVANLDMEAVADALDGGIVTGPFEWRMNEASRLINLALGITTENDA